MRRDRYRYKNFVVRHSRLVLPTVWSELHRLRYGLVLPGVACPPCTPFFILAIEATAATAAAAERASDRPPRPRPGRAVLALVVCVNPVVVGGAAAVRPRDGKPGKPGKPPSPGNMPPPRRRCLARGIGEPLLPLPPTDVLPGLIPAATSSMLCPGARPGKPSCPPRRRECPTTW